MAKLPFPLKLLALVFALVAGAIRAQADEAQEIGRLVKAGAYARAIARADAALQARPQDANLRFQRALALTKQGASREAISAFKRLSEDFPGLPEPYNNLAVLYAQQGDYDQARLALEAAMRTHPSYATTYENLGDVYTRLASQAYSRALKLDAQDAGARNKLALIDELLGGPPRPAPSGAISVAHEAPVTAPKPPGAALAAPVGAPTASASAESSAVSAPPRPQITVRPHAHATREVTIALQAWAQAWSRKDVKRYLGFYDAQFVPPLGETRARWAKQRRARISAPLRIQVAVRSARISEQPDGSVLVRFMQDYRSDQLISTGTRKSMTMVQTGGRWLIREERVEH